MTGCGSCCHSLSDVKSLCSPLQLAVVTGGNNTAPCSIMLAGGKSGVRTTVETYVWVEKKNTGRTEVTGNFRCDEVHLAQVISQEKNACTVQTRRRL